MIKSTLTIKTEKLAPLSPPDPLYFDVIPCSRCPFSEVEIMDFVEEDSRKHLQYKYVKHIVEFKDKENDVVEYYKHQKTSNIGCVGPMVFNKIDKFEEGCNVQKGLDRTWFLHIYYQ